MVFLNINNTDEVLLFLRNELKVFNKSAGEEIYHFINEYTNNSNNQLNEESSSNFIQSCFSQSKNFLAAISEDKKLLIWNWKSKTVLRTIHLSKRPTCLSFCKQNENFVLVGDKYGDVYRCNLQEVEQQPTLLLGHLSMVLDMVSTDDDKFVITADRDEKIRVSLYPNAYSIQSYCLGHTKLISKIELLSATHLISCSADCTLRLWDYKDGKEMFNVELLSYTQSKDTYLVNKVVFDGQINIFLTAEKSEKLLHLKYNGNTISCFDVVSLPGIPLSMCLDGGCLVVLLQNKETPVFVHPVNDKNVSKDLEISFNKLFRKYNISFEDIVLPLTYTNLVKPDNLKRPGVITPESTINLESAAKKQKPNIKSSCNAMEE